LILLLYLFHMSYFPYEKQNGSQFSKSNEKDNKCQYNFLGKKNQITMTDSFMFDFRNER
jgi:hypothetical protein